jgi:hypothetical protein
MIIENEENYITDILLHCMFYLCLYCSCGLLHSAASIAVPEYINADRLHEYEKNVTYVKKRSSNES